MGAVKTLRGAFNVRIAQLVPREVLTRLRSKVRDGPFALEVDWIKLSPEN